MILIQRCFDGCGSLTNVRLNNIMINNKIDPLLIQELFMNYSIYGLSTHKKIIVIETIVNIYKNKEKIYLINYI